MNDTKQYAVHIRRWDLYRVIIAARSPETAREEAERLSDEGEDGQLTHCDGGIDYIEAEEVQS